jgi:hypothetical protein
LTLSITAAHNEFFFTSVVFFSSAGDDTSSNLAIGIGAGACEDLSKLECIFFSDAARRFPGGENAKLMEERLD